MRDHFGNDTSDYDAGVDKDQSLDVAFMHRPAYLHDEMDDDD